MVWPRWKRQIRLPSRKSAAYQNNYRVRAGCSAFEARGPGEAPLFVQFAPSRGIPTAKLRGGVCRQPGSASIALRLSLRPGNGLLDQAPRVVVFPGAGRLPGIPLNFVVPPPGGCCPRHSGLCRSAQQHWGICLQKLHSRPARWYVRTRLLPTFRPLQPCKNACRSGKPCARRHGSGSPVFRAGPGAPLFSWGVDPPVGPPVGGPGLPVK